MEVLLRFWLCILWASHRYDPGVEHSLVGFNKSMSTALIETLEFVIKHLEVRFNELLKLPSIMPENCRTTKMMSSRLATWLR
jgi:hypothetical protein